MNLPIPKLPSFDTAQITADATSSATVQAGVIIFVFFILITLIAVSRRYLTHSSMQGVWSGMFIGFLLVVGVEAGIIYAMKELTSGEKGQLVPANIRAALGTGQENLTQVLGVSTERKIPTAQSVVLDYDDLGKLDAKFVEDYICKPSQTENIQGTIQ